MSERVGMNFSDSLPKQLESLTGSLRTEVKHRGNPAGFCQNATYQRHNGPMTACGKCGDSDMDENASICPRCWRYKKIEGYRRDAKGRCRAELRQVLIKTAMEKNQT